MKTQQHLALAALTEHADAIRKLGKQTLENVIEIGRRLTECRNHPDMKHGDWLPWLEREFGWKEHTARNFMRVHELSKSRNFLDLDIPLSALYMLAAPSTSAEVREEIIARAEAGKSITVAEVKSAIAKAKPEPKPKLIRGVHPAAAALFANEDQLDAFAHAVNTEAARKYISHDQHVDVAKALIEANVRAASFQSWVTQWLRQAGKAQSKIDAEERDD